MFVKIKTSLAISPFPHIISMKESEKFKEVIDTSHITLRYNKPL